MLQILNSLPNDLDTIFNLYDAAIAYQKTKFNKHWLPFDKAMVVKEIEELRQWKIMEADDVACIFSIAYDDPFIWGAKNADPSVYIHRIVTSPAFKGKGYMNTIVEWAKEHAHQHSKKFIRMDTWGDNEELIHYYVRCGFNYLGSITPTATEHLPKHYSAIYLALLEMTA